MDTSLSESVVTFRTSLQVVHEIQESGVCHLPEIVGTYVGMVRHSISRIERSSRLRTAAVPHRAAVTARKQAARELLREVHARPLCTMARVMESDVVGMVKLFHMPYDHLNDRNFVEAMLSLVKDAESYRTVFIAKGCPPDFLERFMAAIHDFETLLEEQRLNRQCRAAARGEQSHAVREGKGALLYLDAILSPLLYGHPRLLAGWRQACFPNRRIGGTRRRRLRSPDALKALPPAPAARIQEPLPAALPSVPPAGGIVQRLLGRSTSSARR